MVCHVFTPSGSQIAPKQRQRGKHTTNHADLKDFLGDLSHDAQILQQEGARLRDAGQRVGPSREGTAVREVIPPGGPQSHTQPCGVNAQSLRGPAIEGRGQDGDGQEKTVEYQRLCVTGASVKPSCRRNIHFVILRPTHDRVVNARRRMRQRLGRLEVRESPLRVRPRPAASEHAPSPPRFPARTDIGSGGSSSSSGYSPPPLTKAPPASYMPKRGCQP